MDNQIHFSLKSSFAAINRRVFIPEQPTVPLGSNAPAQNDDDLHHKWNL
jgi:hypothetical protein